MKLITFTPKRDILGRFVPSKKRMFKFLFVVLALASFYGNYVLASKIWNFQCAESGYFTTKQACGDIAEYKRDAQEAYRVVRVSEAKAEVNHNCVGNEEVCD